MKAANYVAVVAWVVLTAAGFLAILNDARQGGSFNGGEVHTALPAHR